VSLRPGVKVLDRRCDWRRGVVVRRAFLPTAWVVLWFGNLQCRVARAVRLRPAVDHKLGL
jgi:hypothetical protein